MAARKSPVGKIETLLRWWPRIQARLFTLLIQGQFQHIGRGTRITPPFRFASLHEISLGARVIINRDCWIGVISGHGDPELPKLIIKSCVGIGMGATISAASRITIGEQVLLARNVYISDHSHAYEDPSKPIMDQGISGIAPVSIGRNSWLGQNVVVLPGSRIGEHCIIGANSLVKGSIPDFSVAVGAPARVIKRYDLESRKWVRVSLAAGH